MALAHSPKIITDGLVLCLDAGNTKSYPGSGTAWTDLSSKGNNGTLVNGVGYDGNEGGSLSFDGDNDYIDLGTQPIDSDLNMSSPSGGGLTVDWWGYYNGTGDSFQRIVDRSNGSSSANGWAIYTSAVGSSTDIRLTTTGESVIITSSQQMVANVWQHWCITWDQSSGNWAWYLNGQQTNNGNSTWNIPAVETGMRIGTWNHSTGREYNGKISSIKIYNRALTAAEIQQNFNPLRGRFSI